MPSIDLQKKRIASKIVYYGPGLSGKSSNLKSLHAKLPPEHRGRLQSVATKANPSVYIDILPVKFGKVLGFDTSFTVCAVPGQAFYNKTRKLLLKGTDGVVFVADSKPARRDANVDSLNNLRENLEERRVSLENVPMVLQYNKRDLSDAVDVGILRQELNLFGVPEFEASATTGQGVLETLKSILELVSRDLEKRI